MNSESITKSLEAHLQSEEFDLECKARFEDFDRDKSGFVDRDELKKVAGLLVAGMPDEYGLPPKDVTDQEVDEIMKLIDTNTDGKITYEEFKAFFISLVKQMLEEIKGGQIE